MRGKLVLAGALGVGALAVGGGVIANANHQPADKPFAAASKTTKFSQGARVELLSATVKNSKPSDMVLQVSMECSIITDNVILGGTTPGMEQSATTSGAVRAWIEIDGRTVPVMSDGTTAAGDESDKVTFCSRVFNRTVRDQEDPQDGIDYSRDYIETKDANSFNWVRLNMGSGTHTIKLFADLTSASSTGSSASAYVGNRSLVGLPGKFANDATITENTG